MIGYKAFDKELKCRGFQFEVGKTYKTGAEKGELKLCTDTVFHFCRELHRIESVSNYTLSNSRVCEVIAVGEIVTDGDKYGTNKIKILREIPQDELNKYNNCNTGDWNTGNRNTGDCNTGDCNTGDWNTGDRNTGNCNTGDWNTGDRNTGDRNTGNWNTGNRNTGCFNTDTPMLRMFNQETDKGRDDIKFPDFLYFNLTVWVSHDTATQDEKVAHKTEIECFGGFLKKLDYKDAFKKAYENADKEEHYQLFALPNYNPDIFEEISGIDTREEYNEWLKTGGLNDQH